jgi:Ser/Thr protein kinase RdoA (MazF antagonist)
VSSKLESIAYQFSGGRPIQSITGLGNGLINDTFKVITNSGAFVLQRINHQVFPQPKLLMLNLERLGKHIRTQTAITAKLQIPQILLTGESQSYVQDNKQQYWRALELISETESREHLSNSAEAKQVGFALAHFHRLCSTLPPAEMHDTLPGFHITPGYFQQYQTLAQNLPDIKSNAQINYCQTFIDDFQDNIETLENAKQQGHLKERIIHGDPKLNNFLFQKSSNSIISLIDLDTVKPGLVHYDIGDCLRSCCHNTQDNSFDLDHCAAILSSYLLEAKAFFTPADYNFLYPAIQLIPFELGLRFFNDYLAGNIYFKVQDPQQNLQRAIAQFQLCVSIDKRRLQIEKIISELSHS